MVVQVEDRLGPRVIVQRVYTELSPETFMDEIYEKNFKGEYTIEQFKRKVKMVSRPWKIEADGGTNVTLEGSADVMESLLNWGDATSSTIALKCLSLKWSGPAIDAWRSITW